MAYMGSSALFFKCSLFQIKMELVTAAFFDEGDFSNVSLLKDAFHHLNDCLNNSYSQHLFDGKCYHSKDARLPLRIPEVK